ncbi:Elongation of fatty acids protein 2 [Tulasnella sp. 408]|nr:Elongation of fatty acids protein 2 [Tulasnella sp. 408]
MVEVNLQKALEGLEMNMSQFVELCILLGCDYLEPIKGVGPKSALKLIREHGSLKEVVKHLRAKQSESEINTAKAKEQEEEEEEEEDRRGARTGRQPAANEDDEDSDASKRKPAKKTSRRIEDSDEEDGDHLMCDAEEDGSDAEGKEAPASSQPKAKSATGKGKAKASPKKASAASKPKPKGKGGISVPEYWPWEEAKELFLKPDVTPADQLELNWEAPGIDGLVEFLVREKGFNEDRVRKAAEKLQKMLAAKQQGRLDGFFTVKPKEEAGSWKGGKDAKGTKRKASAHDDASPYNHSDY